MSTPPIEQVVTTTAPATVRSAASALVPKSQEAAPKSETKKKRIGLAFQGGGFPAGAVGAGVIKGLAEKGLFGPFYGISGEEYKKAENYEIVAFSGTSAGALLATLCWAHAIKRKALPLPEPEDKRRTRDLIEVAARHAMYYAYPNNFAWCQVIDANIARLLSSGEASLREMQLDILGFRPLGDLRPYDTFKQLTIAPWFHMITRDWLRASLAAILYPDEDPVDCFFEKMDALIDEWLPILERRPTMPLTDVFFKPDIAYKTYHSWVPAVPDLYYLVRVLSFADLLAYNLRTMRHKDPVYELTQLVETIKEEDFPQLAVGSSNIFSGEPKSFNQKDVLEIGLDAVVASGSLDEVNGWTIIKKGENQGIYLDGAWGDNPPLSEIVDDKMDEVWIVEFFPKYDSNIPFTPLQRQRRRDELWQNSLVEHEMKEIKVRVRRIAHNFPIDPKASMVNNPWYLRTMMSYGYAAASCFADNILELPQTKSAIAH